MYDVRLYACISFLRPGVRVLRVKTSILISRLQPLFHFLPFSSFLLRFFFAFLFSLLFPFSFSFSFFFSFSFSFFFLPFICFSFFHYAFATIHRRSWKVSQRTATERADYTMPLVELPIN